MYFKNFTIGGHKIHPMALRILFCAHRATIIHGREFVTTKEIDAVYLVTYDKTISGRLISECKTRIHAYYVLRNLGNVGTEGQLWNSVKKAPLNSHYWFVTILGTAVLDMLLNGKSKQEALVESRELYNRKAGSSANPSSGNNLATVDAPGYEDETSRIKKIVENTNLPRPTRAKSPRKGPKIVYNATTQQTDNAGGTCLFFFVVSVVAIIILMAVTSMS